MSGSMPGTRHGVGMAGRCADGLSDNIRFQPAPGGWDTVSQAAFIGWTVEFPSLHEEPRMTRDGDHFRLVVAIFDEPQSLRRALDALTAAGLSADQLCLLARTETLTGLAQDVGANVGDSALARLVGRIQAWPGAPGETRFSATSGSLRDHLARLQRSGTGSATAAASDGALQAAQRPDFADHLGGGAITVVVRSTTPAQQSVTTRTLLGQSTHRVKTYEFTSAL